MQTNLQKIDKVINFFKEALSKHKSLDKDFIEVFLETIDENKDKLKIVANKLKLDTDFYDLFISHNKLDEESIIHEIVKKDNKYYKNFLKLKKYKIIHNQSSGFYPKNIMLVSTNPNPRSFLLSDFSLIDKFDERKKSLVGDLIDNNENMLLNIYYYLRYFHLPSFSSIELKNIKIEDIFIIDENKSFVILYKDTSIIRDVVKDSDIIGWCFLDWSLELNKQAGAQGVLLYAMKSAVAIAKEIGKDHFLYNKKIEVVAKCESNDDVLYVLRNGMGRDIYYLVHLTYSAHNADGFPQYEEFADLFAVKEFIERSYIEDYM